MAKRGKRTKAEKRRRKHPFQKYYRSRGHYPRAKLSLAPRPGDPLYNHPALHNSEALRSLRLEASLTPTYLTLRTHLHGSVMYIPARELIALIEWLTPLLPKMSDEVFNPDLQVMLQNALEDDYKKAIRVSKKRRPRA